MLAAFDLLLIDTADCLQAAVEDWLPLWHDQLLKYVADEQQWLSSVLPQQQPALFLQVRLLIPQPSTLPPSPHIMAPSSRSDATRHPTSLPNHPTPTTTPALCSCFTRLSLNFFCYTLCYLPPRHEACSTCFTRMHVQALSVALKGFVKPVLDSLALPDHAQNPRQFLKTVTFLLAATTRCSAELRALFPNTARAVMSSLVHPLFQPFDRFVGKYAELDGAVLDEEVRPRGVVHFWRCSNR